MVIPTGAPCPRGRVIKGVAGCKGVTRVSTELRNLSCVIEPCASGMEDARGTWTEREGPTATAINNQNQVTNQPRKTWALNHPKRKYILFSILKINKEKTNRDLCFRHLR